MFTVEEIHELKKKLTEVEAEKSKLVAQNSIQNGEIVEKLQAELKEKGCLSFLNCYYFNCSTLCRYSQLAKKIDDLQEKLTRTEAEKRNLDAQMSTMQLQIKQNQSHDDKQDENLSSLQNELHQKSNFSKLMMA